MSDVLSLESWSDSDWTCKRAGESCARGVERMLSRLSQLTVGKKPAISRVFLTVNR